MGFEPIGPGAAALAAARTAIRDDDPAAVAELLADPELAARLDDGWFPY